MVARISGNLQQLPVAESAASAVLSSPFAVPYFAVAATVGLALIAVQSDDAVAAQQQYAALEAATGVMALYIGTDRLLGLLAQTTGNLDQAAVHFEESMAFSSKAGYRPELAWACCDYADALLQRRNSGDSQKAVSLLEKSRDIAMELGMGPLRDRASAKLAAAAQVPAAAPTYPDGLSHREVEVLLLVSRGRTNQQIADELFITTRTVANHVTNILNKTGAANRTEAAAYSVQHGLV